MSDERKTCYGANASDPLCEGDDVRAVDVLYPDKFGWHRVNLCQRCRDLLYPSGAVWKFAVGEP